MADPIRKLLGVELDSPNIIPEQQAPVPPPNVAPPLPVPVAPVESVAPAQDTVPPLPLNVSTLTPQTPLQLPSPVAYGSDGVAPVAVSGAQQALQVLAPVAQKDVFNYRTEQAESTAFSLSPNALPPTDTWEPPDLDATISNYGANMAVLRQSFAAQTAARQNADEREWLERNMARIEAMNNPKSSPTADAFGWVGEMLGTSEDGSRTYVGAAYMDKKSGDWKGSPVGTVLYGLGVLQNSAMGALIDTKNMLRNVDKGMKSAYETFTPPWMRGSMDTALGTLGKVLGHISPVVGAYQAATSGPSVSGVGTYNDGKSNFLEALRGAQFSFSDKASKGGLGLDYNKGIRVKDTSGKQYGINIDFDLNPGVVAGLVGDVLLGGKVDKLAGAALRKMGYTGGKAVAKAVVSAAPPAAAPPSVFKFAQLEIPFTSGPVPTNKVPRPKAAPKARIPVKGDVQQVLQIDQMMKEFGEADRLTNPLAYKSGRAGADDGQLALRLGKIDYTPVVRNAPIKTPRFPSPGKQLKLDFTDLPEAVPPKNIKVARPVTEIIDVPTPAQKGEAINVAQGIISRELDAAKVRMAIEPDIGRRPILTSSNVAIAPVSVANVDFPTISVPTEPLVHGTRVSNLVVSNADPSKGAALSELGAGIYISGDRELARIATFAANTEGLPSVAGRKFLPEGEGAIHEVVINPTARLIDANIPIPSVTAIAEQVASNFPGLRGRPRLSVEETYVNIIDIMAEAENSAAARLQFQQEFTKALREAGVDGVSGNGNTAIFNPAVLETRGVEKVISSVTPDDAYNARAAIEIWGEEANPTKLSTANSLDAQTVALNQKLNSLEVMKRQAAKETWQDIQYAGLMDHPSRVPSLEEYARLVIDDLYSTSESAAVIADVGKIDTVISERLLEIIKERGYKVEYKELGSITRGSANTQSGTIFMNPTLGMNDLSKTDVIKTMIHELGHMEISKLVPYVGDGVVFNELVVEGIANTVVSILVPKSSEVRKTMFDVFYDHLTSSRSNYFKLSGGSELLPEEVLEKYGTLVTKLAINVIEEIAPSGFKVPSLDKLRIFQPSNFEVFANDKYVSKSSLSEVFNTSIKTLDEGLSVASKIDVVATNPVTGKLNLKVRDMLYDRFMDDDLLKGSLLPQVDSLVEKWATSLSKSLDPKRADKAKKVLDMMQVNPSDTDEYIKRLTAIDKQGAKQYVPAIRRGVDDVQIRKYC